MDIQRTETAFNPITEGSIGREMIRFMIPIILSSLFQQLYNTVDAIVVGQFIGKEALGAVDSTGAITRLLIFFLVGLASGATILISQLLGGKEEGAARRAVQTATAFAFLGGLFVSALGILLSPLLLEATNVPPENYDYALSYMRIYFGGAVFTVIYNMGAGILKSAGDSRRPFYFLLISSFINIVLDLVFVPVLGLGVAGAAAATVISQLVSAILVIRTLLQTTEPYRLELAGLHIDRDFLGEILRLGFPRGIQSSLFSFSNVLITAGVNSFGSNAAAGFAVAGKLDMIVWFFIEALSVSATTFVGQNYGAGDRKRVFRSVHVCMGYAFLMLVPISLLLWFFGGTLGRLFTSDGEVLELAAFVLRLYAPFYWVTIFTEVYAGSIQGTGETFKPMLVTFFAICVLRAVWMLFIFPLHRTFGMVVVSYPVTWAAAAFLFCIYYKFGAWRKKIGIKPSRQE